MKNTAVSSDDKLKQRLTIPMLTSVIMDAFSRREIMRIMASVGSGYRGVRMESLDHFQLAHGLAEDVFQDTNVFEALVKELDQRYVDDLKDSRSMDLIQIQKIMGQAPKITRQEGGIGCAVWLLLRDGREEVAALLDPFMEAAMRHLAKQDRRQEKEENFVDHLFEGDLNKSETHKVKNMLASLVEKKRSLEGHIVKLTKEVADLTGRNDDMKEVLAAKGREYGALTNELAKSKKEASSKDRVIEELQRKIEAVSSSEEAHLRRKIHELDRDVRKKDHQIGELRESLAESEKQIQTQERRRLELNLAVKDLAGQKEALGGQLSQALARVRAFQEKSGSDTVRSPAVPPEKGRRVGVFVDTQYLWQAAKRLQRKIDFRELLDLVVWNRHLVKAVAYTVTVSGKDQGVFFSMLENKGYQVRTRSLARDSENSVAKVNWSAGMAVDVLHLVDAKSLDVVHVIGASNDFIDLFKYLKAKGVRVEVSGFDFDAVQGQNLGVDKIIPLGEEVFYKPDAS